MNDFELIPRRRTRKWAVFSCEGESGCREWEKIKVQYYQQDNETLARELRWMGIVLRRADIVPLAEKRVIEERLSMYDDLMEKDPKMRRIRAESEAKGLQTSILTIIETRFPTLAALGQQRVRALTKVDELTALLRQLLTVSDEEAARSLLTTLGI